MAKTRECCSALSLRRTGDDLHVSLHKGFKIRLAGIVPVSLEFTVLYTKKAGGKNCRGNLPGWRIDGDDKMREATCART